MSDGYDFEIDCGGGVVDFSTVGIPSNLNNAKVYVTNGTLSNDYAISVDNVTFTFSTTGNLWLYYNASFKNCCFIAESTNWNGIHISNLNEQLNIDFSLCYFENAGTSTTAAIFQGLPQEFKLSVTQCEFIDCRRAISVSNHQFNNISIYNSDFHINNSQLQNTNGTIAIYANNSLITIYGCEFSGYRTGIRSLASTNATILGSDFTNCITGIFSESNSIAFVKTSTFYLNGMSSTGINSFDSYLNSSGNDFQNCKYGINITSKKGKLASNAFNIWKNTFGMSNNAFGLIGINVFNFGNSVSGFTKIHNDNQIGYYNPVNSDPSGIYIRNITATNSIEIKNNTIIGNHNGIVVEGAHSTLIEGNTIYANPLYASNAPFDPWSCIRLVNSVNSLIKGNTISSTNLYANGLNTKAGSYNKFCCNTINQAKKGVTFDEMSTAELKGTEIKAGLNYEGLYLGEFGIIGPQYYSNNTWLQNGSNGAKAEGNNSNYLSSKFTVQNSSSPIHPINVNKSGWFDIINSANITECSSYLGSNCDISWVPNKINKFLNLDSFVVTDNFNDTFGIDQANQVRFNLFYNYLTDSTIYLNDTPILNYVHENINSELYQLSEIKYEISKLLFANTFWNIYETFQSEYLHFSDTLSEKLAERPLKLDSIYCETNWNHLLELKYSADTSLINATTDFETNIVTLQSQISSFSPASIWAFRYKQYYEILSSIIDRDSLYIESAEIDTLTIISSLCTVAYGELVYNAANILNFFGDSIVPSQNACFEPVEIAKFKHAGFKENKIFNNFLDSQNLIENTPVEIYTIDGKLIYIGNYNLDQLMSKLNSVPSNFVIVKNLKDSKFFKLFLNYK